MKTEIVNIPDKGICILISDIDVRDFLKHGEDVPEISFFNGIYNPQIIAENMKKNYKIRAIKELRKQTDWGLRESKNYLDEYYQTFSIYNESTEKYKRAANKFMQDHTPPEDFIKESEMTL